MASAALYSHLKARKQGFVSLQIRVKAVLITKRRDPKYLNPSVGNSSKQHIADFLRITQLCCYHTGTFILPQIKALNPGPVHGSHSVAWR